MAAHARRPTPPHAPRPARQRLARAVPVGIALVLAVAATGCSSPGAREASWHPAPKEIDGLSTLASVVGDGEDARLALHTEHGDVTFWNGVNLGSSPPGHSPGEMALTRDHYARWLSQMADLDVHFLRTYTIHPPEFYEELRAHNEEHPDHPIYLIQGVYLPNEDYLETRDLWDPSSSAAFGEELADASNAVSGDFTRGSTPGRASGTWTADVSEWLAGWVIGVEWDPEAIRDSDRRNEGRAPFHGTYFTSTARATSTEVWLATYMDQLATHEAQRGRSSPIAFANWPTADPLHHPTEPLASEDLVSVDANHVQPTQAWPGGTFANYHAYPYYPDFLRYEYQDFDVDGEQDSYIGYLAALQDYHAQASTPVLISEFGVPASLGSAHLGTRGRDQGNHEEAEAMAMNAAMLRSFPDAGVSGGLLFMWADEWFKFSWNTLPRQAVAHSERRALWHDPLTNEQWFGVIAQDAVPGGWRTTHEARDGVQRVDVQTSNSFAELRLLFDREPNDPIRIEFEAAPGVVDGGSHAVVYDPREKTMTALVRDEVDPILLDGLDAAELPARDGSGWSVQRLTLNRSQTVAGQTHPAEFQEVGRLVEGTWDPSDRAYNSLSTWHWTGGQLELRIPWSMLGLGDPSSHTGVVPDADGKPEAIDVPSIPFTIDAGDGPQELGAIEWEAWQQVNSAERLRPGWEDLRDAFTETSGG